MADINKQEKIKIIIEAYDLNILRDSIIKFLLDEDYNMAKIYLEILIEKYNKVDWKKETK